MISLTGIADQFKSEKVISLLRNDRSSWSGIRTKYVLVDEKGDSYTLSDQEKSKILAGKHVAISGHIDPSEKAIHVHSIVTQ